VEPILTAAKKLGLLYLLLFHDCVGFGDSFLALPPKTGVSLQAVESGVEPILTTAKKLGLLYLLLFHDCVGFGDSFLALPKPECL